MLTPLYFHCSFSVLIETLWNVKGFTEKAGNNHESVLIETLWNVKSPISSHSETPSPF